ncbi:hypothetical protein R1sor_016076 [Riccia sorocarpa]|uniref:Reverse transcriptase domain-containing protein n=1 Tax=Riccia sorocarpa TaxID=122646 RepID=A0ABD3HGQ7_9MARC
MHALKDDDGVLHTDEKKILDLSAQYFSQILQEPPGSTLQLQATEQLLAQTSATVTQTERDTLQSDFTAQELHDAAKLLGKNKCPGPDGVPLEFFLYLWDTISPLLLQATTHGLQQGNLIPFFNKGTITLLHKEGDQAVLKNKRPITLLNVVYKIWAKVLQMRLAPVLQRVISWEQNAFLTGRQLHTTVFLCNEAVFEAKNNKQDCVLLKIDFKKAFDTLRWEFLYAAMRQMQFGERFITFVQTLNNQATSSVRVNNACSKSFAISRSVRQGCPLSPLLFTIAVQVLTDVINSMVLHNQLKGIDLQRIGVHYCQGYFADDSHLLLSADRQNLLNAKSLIHTFGVASGLMVQWGKSKARWVSQDNPMPPWISELDWIWGLNDDSDKLLGFHFKDGLDMDTIFQVALQKIKTRINSPTARSSTIHGRIVIANHLIYGILWFILPLWAAAKPKIRQIERLAQMQAFAVKTIRWAYSPETHPLKSWLLATFNAIASLRWGSDHYTWLSSPSKGKMPSLSPTMLHICELWQATAKFLSPLDQMSLNSWRRLSLWGPKSTGVREVTRSAITGSNARLNASGIKDIADITLDGTTTKTSSIFFGPVPSIAPFWSWAIDLLYIAFPECIRWTPKFSHAVLGKPIPDFCKNAAKWWEAWRCIVLWIIWIRRNEKVFRDSLMSLPRAKALAWHKLILHTREEWKWHCFRADKLDLTLQRRADLDKKIASKHAIVTLKFRVAGSRLFSSW